MGITLVVTRNSALQSILHKRLWKVVLRSLHISQQLDCFFSEYDTFTAEPGMYLALSPFLDSQLTIAQQEHVISATPSLLEDYQNAAQLTGDLQVCESSSTGNAWNCLYY